MSINTSQLGPYDRIRIRFEEISEQLKDKDLPLEQSLDLYEEAIRLGNSCADLIDTAELVSELEQANSEEDVEVSSSATDTSDENVEVVADTDDEAASVDETEQNNLDNSSISNNEVTNEEA